MPKKRNTKLPAIKQLPSGAYHASVYSHTDADGKRHYESITGFDYNKVLLEVAQFKADKKQDKIDRATGKIKMTLGEAMEKYMESKSAVLSPATIRSYRTIIRNYLQVLQTVHVDDLTRDQVQVAINQESMAHSPKTVRNIHGFLTAVLQVYRPDFVLHTTLPQKKKPSISIPTEDEIKKLFAMTEETDLYIPVLLGAVCGMRRGEIGALTWESIDFEKGTITIDQALVLGEDHEWIEKTTKTTAGTRTIRMIPLVANALKNAKEESTSTDGYITIRPDLISNRFYNLIRKSDIPNYRFHDLRHYTVSVMLSLNVPQNYIAGFVGHGSTKMIETVYGHLMASKKTSVEDQMQDYFSKFL
jgi:integrase